MMKAKSRLRTKRDNDTPEKMSDDSRSNIDIDSNNKVNEAFEELRITEEILQKFYNVSNYEDDSKINRSTLAVRYELPPDKQKPQTRKICVLKRAPGNVAAVPSSTLLEQVSLRLDDNSRPVQHSILGSLDDFFKMSINKKMLTLQEIPPEFQHVIDENVKRRPITSMFPPQRKIPHEDNVSSPRKLETSRIQIDSDTKALKLWEQRMLERRNLQTHISKKVQRVPEELVLNSGEGYRRKLENNYLITKSIPFYGSGYGFRSGSEFWKQNEVLGVNKGDLLHMSNTQAEKGYPPPIVHVGVANQIKTEKGVPLQDSTSNSTHKDYVQRRYNELRQVISELNPHQPDIDELIITGSHITENGVLEDHSSELNDLSEILNRDAINDSFASQELYREDTDPSKEQMFQIYAGPCLVVNDMFINNSGDRTPIDIRILFNDYTRNKCVEKIHFHNKGSSIIRFWWKKLESYDPFELVNKATRRFYFNTQDGILLPNQEMHFPLIFKSDKSGIFSEQWRLETLPTLTYERDIVITLKGVALQRDTLTNTRKKIETYLNYRVANDVVREVLDDILRSMFYNMRDNSLVAEPEDSESEIFSSVNETIIYRPDNVYSLKKLHRELTTKEANMSEEWDLSCGQLKEDIYRSGTLVRAKKEDACTKLYKHIDMMMFSPAKSFIVPKDLLYRIGYRILVDFGGDMFTVLADLRKSHDIPDMELRLSRDKKGSNLSRQRTSNSQSSKISKKQNESRASISTSKMKSKEPTMLRDSTDVNLAEIDEADRIASRSASDVDEPIVDNELPQGSSMNPNVEKYHKKSHQMVYALLDGAIDNIIAFWDDLSKN